MRYLIVLPNYIIVCTRTAEQTEFVNLKNDLNS